MTTHLEHPAESVPLTRVAEALRRAIQEGLTGLVAAVQVLKARLDDTELERRIGASIDGRLGDLEEVLLTMELLAEGQLARTPEPLSLGLLLADVASRLARETQGSARLDLPTGADLEIVADRRQVEALLMHLCRNAWEAQGSAGPAIGVAWSLEPDGSVRVRVSDAGPGPELADPFEAFVSNKAGRLGLGLTLARVVAHGHGGEVSLRAGSPSGGVAEVRLAPASSIRRTIPPAKE